VISDAAREELSARFGASVAFGVAMARYTSLRVGGPADVVATPRDRDELAGMLAWAAAQGIPHHVLGAGFNTLVQDAGIDGLVLVMTKLRGLEDLPDGSLGAEAGASHHRVTKHCIERGLSGLEFAAGIPGTVGGWIAMNAGIGVREMRDVVQEVEWLRGDGSGPERRARGQLDFRYRELANLPAGAVVVAARFGLAPVGREAVAGEVERHLARRAETQPLDVPSCGSVFKNPPGEHAGRLIEAAGLKGEREGGAQISTVHANFIVNRGRATAADVLALLQRARERVFDATGILLEPEVKILGRQT
jgi:UDP-N-acetylmuramate dehydrogenase